MSSSAPFSPRIGSLDALRGIAALLVVFSHCYGTLPYAVREALAWTDAPFRLLVLGRPAVILFFVLSGFVLSLSLERRQAEGYRSFAIRRFFRIYPPFAVAILASAALYLAIRPQPFPGVSEWFIRDVWSDPVGWRMLLAHLAMIGRAQDVTLNGPMWSLIVEMRLSLLFPLLFGLLWLRKPAALAALAGLVVLTELIGRKTSLGIEPYFNETVAEAVWLTLYFTSFFVAGIVLAQQRERLAMLAWRARPWGQAALWLAALALLSSRRDIVNGAGATLIIGLAFCSPWAQAFLERSPLQWLGRVSYSLYLVHVPVLAVMVYLFGQTAPLAIVILAVVPASLLTAQLSYLLIERPSMRLGSRLARRVRKTDAVRTDPQSSGGSAGSLPG